MIQAHIRDKKIDVTDIKYILVESDHCDTIQFVMKSTYNGVDLSSYAFLLRWQNVDGEGDDIVLLKSVSDGKIYLSFTPGGAFTSVSGRMSIQIRGSVTTNGVSYNWNSEIANIYISNLLAPDAVDPVSPSAYQQVLDQMAGLDSAIQEAVSAKTQAQSASGTAVEAKDAAVAAKNTAVSASGTATQAKNAAVAAKDDAVTAKRDAEAAKEEARAYAEIAEAAGGTYAVVINGVPYSILFCVDDDQTHLGLKFSPISA